MSSRRVFIVRSFPGALTMTALMSCRQTSQASPRTRPDAELRKRGIQGSTGAVQVSKGRSATDLSAVWDTDIAVGDCTIHKGATFELDSNGNNRWECDISSTDTGDDAKLTMWLYDGAAKPTSITEPLALVGEYGFDIHDANTVKHWLQVFGPGAIFYNMGGLGPMELVARTTWVWPSCNC